MMKRQLSIVAIILCGILSVSAEEISVNGPVLVSGGSATMEIVLSNERTDLVAFQMDLLLPEGVSIDKSGCAPSSRITDEEQELTIGKLESGAYRLTSASMSLAPISGTSGTLLSIKLTSDGQFVNGDATISNIRFSTSESERITMNDVTFNINTLYSLIYKVDGEVYETSAFAYGSNISNEAEPQKEGYTFSGWSKIPETMPAHDVTITGTFTVNRYSVTYKYGDEVLSTTEVEYGSEIPLPESLNSERYTLVEWLDVPATMPARDIVIQASYTDGVMSIENQKGHYDFYLLNGIKPKKSQRGITIVRMTNGKMHKVVVK